MFPIRDHNPSSRVAFVTYTLIAINVVIFALQWPLMSNDPALWAYYDSWAMIPADVVSRGEFHTLFTSMFLHGSVMHLGGNMLFLYIFGDNMEDEMGHLGFSAFYIGCGLAAGVAHLISAPFSDVPTVGASGAIAAVMGGYLLLFPRAKIDILIIIVVIIRIIPVPAFLMLAVWFGMQFLGAFGSDPMTGGVAYWAHAGGFVAGLVATVPVWLKLGGPRYWRATDGHPPHPEARYRLSRSTVPTVRRRREWRR